MTTPAAAVPAGYTLVLPPGWVRIPLRSGTGEALDELVFKGIEKIPPEVPRDQGMRYRLRVRRNVERLVMEAQRANGLDLFLPARPPAGTFLAASFLVSEVFITADGNAPPEAVLARLAAEEKRGAAGEVITVADTLALRREYVEPPDPEQEIETSSRNVEYILPVPHDARRWLMAAFSTPGEGHPDSELAHALVELFDALMTTFRWRHA